MAETDTSPRPIWICADDYGMSPGISKAIRDLVTRGRLNATSAMVAAPSFDRGEALSLSMLNIGTQRVAIGLHVTLTKPFRPLGAGFRPLRGGAFLSLAEMMVRGQLGLLDRGRLAEEIATQLRAFVTLFGRPPDFIDGHQHVHLFPQVRNALLDVMKVDAPVAWVRQCGNVSSVAPPTWDYKARVLNALSRKFRELASARGVAFNPAFAGTYDFLSAGEALFARLFPDFLRDLPPHSVVMCHPGFVDEELTRLDPLTKQREWEYSYLTSDAFLYALRTAGLALETAPPATA
jgi:predicted glycoside hydrolase/deacetylase ChbG (UPF0249 family)